MTRKDNRIVVDLNKVQWARFGYRNKDGDWRNLKPEMPTVHNQSFDEDAQLFGTIDSPVSMLQYAIDHKLLDVWIPECRLKVTANCILTYTGDRAISIWKEWSKRQFNRNKKK